MYILSQEFGIRGATYMKIVVQRVKEASVSNENIENKIKKDIAYLLVLVKHLPRLIFWH